MSSSALRRSRTVLPRLLALLLPLLLITLLPGSAARIAYGQTSTIVVYGDALASTWRFRSAAGVTANASATSPVFSGTRSYSVRYTAARANFRLELRQGSLALNTYKELRFAIHGGTNGGQRVRVLARNSAGTNTVLGTVTAQAGAWTVSLPIANTTALATVSELRWQEDLGSAQATLYLDQIEIIAPPVATATATNTATPTDTVTVTSTSTPDPSLPTATATNTPLPTSTRQPTTGTLKIMPLGDSITEGVNGGYRVGLWERLLAAGYTVDYVGPRNDPYATIPDKDHAGTPGFNTGNILSALDGYMNTYQPDIVLLMIGTNDIAWWTADTNVADSTAANVGRIIDRIAALKPGTRVILATTPPISSNVIQIVNLDRAELIRQYNVALRQLAAQRGITLVDVEAALTLADLYDGVHPGYEAHITKIAPLWAAAIMQ